MICSKNKNIDKAIAENQTTCLSENDTLESEQTNGKNSSRVNDLNNLRLINANKANKFLKKHLRFQISPKLQLNPNFLIYLI